LDTMEKLRATTNSFSQVGEYGDQYSKSRLPQAARNLFFEDVTWPGFNLTRYILSSLRTVNLLARCATTSVSRKLLYQDANQSKSLHCSSCLLVLAGDEPDRAGGRAYSVRKVSRAIYLFCLVRQSAIGIAV